ncbi:hypothetical protein [Thalassospira tepidiphila]|uniref:Uncharacterized protein n=2 Tax=Thalassospira tepidiphila TaxID=393657 RepID=A0A853L4A7_9PROT|nr:hypothetical protein [Thalassospira tepidiphila]NJB74200.1 hypothetical protein [Thalassospira tepidiphila]OAZ11662.1 hypothetical protein TH4_00820 [Thalassospira tepidiphila MCCC 1A03514]
MQLHRPRCRWDGSNHHFAAHGFAAHGLAAHGFFAAHGLAAHGFAAHGLHGLTTFLAAHGFAAQGFAAQGFAAQGLAAHGLHGAQLATSAVGAGSGSAIAIGVAMARLVPIAIAGMSAFCAKVMDFLVMSCLSEDPVSSIRGVPSPIGKRTMIQFFTEAASHGFTVV